MFSVTTLLTYFLCVMLCLLHFYVFIHLHLASHLGTLDELREGLSIFVCLPTELGGLYHVDEPRLELKVALDLYNRSSAGCCP